MLKISAKKRSEDDNITSIRESGFLPGIIYGYETDNLMVSIDSRDFEKVYKEAGESTLIKVDLKDEKGKKTKENLTVLIQETQLHPVTDDFTHVDLYQPNLKEEVEVEIPLEFTGQSLAVKEEDGTLVKNISEITIKALPESLIHEIQVDISSLETFDDVIKISDLETPKGVEIVDDAELIVASIARPQDIDEELEEPIEEGLEDVEVVGEKEDEEEEGEESDDETQDNKPKKEE